jgi:hypothetical protein
MADPVCTAASLVESAPCLAGPVLTERQQQAIRIWFNVKELQALGGTNYSAVLDSTLISDAVALADTMNLSQRRTAVMSIHKDNAVEAGASIPLDTNELLDNVKCFIHYPDLDALELLLLCKLGKHATYPQ